MAFVPSSPRPSAAANTNFDLLGRKLGFLDSFKRKMNKKTFVEAQFVEAQYLRPGKGPNANNINNGRRDKYVPSRVA